jgi:hypothetical protein
MKAREWQSLGDQILGNTGEEVKLKVCFMN